MTPAWLLLLPALVADDAPATPDADSAAVWEAQVSDTGLRTASVEGPVRFGDLQARAQLRLTCRPGADGTVGWTLRVADADEFGEFGFGDFEGPDAAAAANRLTEVALSGGLLQTRVTTEVAGWYDAELPGAFILGFSAGANAASNASLLADTIGSATREIAWRTASFADTTRGIEARFDAAGAAPAVHEAMMGCGPPPELAKSDTDAWMGRNPAAVELWSRRAIEWRLKGLLGHDFERVLARLSHAEPLGRAGDVLFVIAPDREKPDSGVVVMFSREGDTEVISVEAGEVVRYRSGTRQIKPPPAVREFIGARVAARPAAPDAADAPAATDSANDAEGSGDDRIGGVQAPR